MRSLLPIALLILITGCASSTSGAASSTSPPAVPTSDAAAAGRATLKSWDNLDCVAARARARESKFLPTDTLYPPTPVSILLPPLPLPGSLKQNGVDILFTMRVDSAGNVISGKSFTSPQVAESSYQKKLNAMMAGTKFRPAILGRCEVEGTHTLRWKGA